MRICWLIVLLWIGNDGLFAQGKQGPDPYIQDSVSIIQVERDPAAFKYEELQLAQSPMEASSEPYLPGPIGRSYYVNNPFDIDDFSNPFNLPRPGSRPFAKPQQAAQKNLFRYFSTLFAYENSSTSVNDPSDHSFPEAPAWMFFLMLLLLSYFTYLLTLYRPQVRKALQAVTNPALLSQQFRESKGALSPSDINKYLLFLLALAVFIFSAINILSHSPQNQASWHPGLLGVLFVGLLAAQAAKHAQLKLIAMIFPFKQEVEFYNYIIFSVNKLMGFMLVPALFLVHYSPQSWQSVLFYLTIGILLIAYIFRYIRGILSAREVILFHKFHFFVYLCTVEIAPVLILLKLTAII